MGVTPGQKHGIAAFERLPFAGRLLQFRLTDADEMKPCGVLFGKSRRPGCCHAATAVFHTVQSQATQHLGQGIIHGHSQNSDDRLRNFDFMA